MKIAHIEASNIVPTMVNQRLSENMLKKEAGNILKNTLLENIPNVKRRKDWKDLSLQGIESWSEQQQQSAISLIREYQHLFAWP